MLPLLEIKYVYELMWKSIWNFRAVKTIVFIKY